MNQRIAAKKRQSGQTLIETLVAIFILVTGLMSAISLAIYSFRSTDNTSKQIIATALARESMEAVKNIRDSNWLSDTLVDCNDLGANQKCYANWLGNGDGSKTLSAGDMVVDFSNAGGINDFSISKNPANYFLYYQTNGSNSGQYHNTPAGTLTVYQRKVHIDEDQTTPPYTIQNPRLTVTVTVWWSGRSCPATNNPDSAATSCKVILQSYLTNWRNF